MASGSTTVGALPYPVSTDAPSVHTDIQALAQALANRLTSPTSVGTSQTLADGQLAVSTASPITLTLPTAATNVKCGVFAKVATGSNPVTVSAPGGALIYGVGLNGVASLTLATIGSFVILQSDGTNWYIIAGQPDAPWVPLTLPSGFVPATGAYAPAARIIGNKVELSGGLRNNTGGTVSGTLATLPSSAFAPASNVGPTAASNDSSLQTVPLFISAGTTAITGTLTNTKTIWLDGASYRLV